MFPYRLTGISPFAGDTQLETFQNILDCIVDYSREEMQNVSDLAKDFIQRLLVRNPRKRATVNECLQHPWIKPKDNKQSNCRRDSLISKEKLSSLRHFIATNPNANVLSMNNTRNTEEQDKFPSSPTSPLYSDDINDKPRFSFPDCSFNNKVHNTTPLDQSSTQTSSSNQTVESKQLCKNESNQNSNTVQTAKRAVVNHVLQARNVSAFTKNNNTYLTSSESSVISHVCNSQAAESQNMKESNRASQLDIPIPINAVKMLNPRNSLPEATSTISFPQSSDKNITSNNNLNTNSKIFSDLTSDKTVSDSTSNKSNNCSSSSTWRANFQNNIIGRLGAAFTAATAHVTTSTHHTLTTEANSSSNHQLTFSVKSSASPLTSTTTITTINTTKSTTNTTLNKTFNFVQLTTKEIVKKNNSSKSTSKNKNINNDQSYSYFNVVSRAVKELEITASPINNPMTTNSSNNNNNNTLTDLKIVHRFQSLGMNPITETTHGSRPLQNGYPNEKTTCKFKTEKFQICAFRIEKK
ncbi:Death-associated protein kinase 1 [Schistosoma japonicum]|nr:Death-associated protein kinase 1 [Schistosoma japonicum]